MTSGISHESFTCVQAEEACLNIRNAFGLPVGFVVSDNGKGIRVRQTGEEKNHFYCWVAGCMTFNKTHKFSASQYSSVPFNSKHAYSVRFLEGFGGTTYSMCQAY